MGWWQWRPEAEGSSELRVHAVIAGERIRGIFRQQHARQPAEPVARHLDSGRGAQRIQRLERIAGTDEGEVAQCLSLIDIGRRRVMEQWGQSIPGPYEQSAGRVFA